MSKRGIEHEFVKRRKKVRMRFRALIRMAIFNKTWLQDIEEQKISTNIKKNIAMLVRQERKIGILTMADKALIRTLPYQRSVEDRKKLVNLMLNLTCFAPFPPFRRHFRVSRQTAAVLTQKFECSKYYKRRTKPGGKPQTSAEVQCLSFLWFAGNKNTYREVSNLFDMTLSSAYRNQTAFLEFLFEISPDYIKMPRTDLEKRRTSSEFEKKIRARLSRVVKFIYLNPGRTIIKEGHDPIAVYFILTGEVEVTRTVYCHETKSYIEKLDYISGPGDCIGEIEFLENCYRQQTCKATNDVELLIVYEEDFNEVLRPFMAKQWQEKKIALAAFEYFKDWTLSQIIYVCKVGLLKQYEPLETIYCEDKGPLSLVHFVISGQCMILQCLKMKVTEKKGRKSYSLVEIQEGDTSMMFGDMSSKEILKKLRESRREGGISVEGDDDSVRSSEESEGDQAGEEEVAGVYKRARKTDYKKYALMCGVDLDKEFVNERRTSVHEDAVQRISTKAQNLRRRSQLSTSPPRMSIQAHFHAQPTNPQIPTHNENHFIDVGSLTFGGIFGLGEQLVHRVVMARTTVQCLLIPRFWLFEKDQNPGNIWQRMRFYLDSTIPSRELLFQDFLATRKWHKFKNKVLVETLDTSKVGNPTKVQDIPVICRIVEANDVD